MHARRRRRILGAGAHARTRNAEGRRIAARWIARSGWQARGLGPHLRSFERRHAADGGFGAGASRPSPPKIRTRTCRTPPSWDRSRAILQLYSDDIHEHRHCRRAFKPRSRPKRPRCPGTRASRIPKALRSARTPAQRVFANSRGFRGQLSHQQLLVERDAGGAPGRFDGARLTGIHRRAATPSSTARPQWDGARRSAPYGVWAPAKSRRRKCR